MESAIDTDVLIAWGGPTGQMLACELALGGVTATVLDALHGRTPNPAPMGSADSRCGFSTIAAFTRR